jgi:hypothetical protein
MAQDAVTKAVATVATTPALDIKVAAQDRPIMFETRWDADKIRAAVNGDYAFVVMMQDKNGQFVPVASYLMSAAP